MRAGDQVAPAIPIEVVAGSAARASARQDPFGWTRSATRSRRCSAGGAGGPRRRRSSSRRHPRAPACASASRSCSRTRSTRRPRSPIFSSRRPRSSPASGSRTSSDRPASPSGEAVTVEGESYRRFPILRKLLFPTKAGTLTLPRRHLPHRPRAPGLLRRGRSRGARDEARDGHGRPAAGRGRLLGRGGPLRTSASPRPRRRAARRGGDAPLPRRGHRQPEVDRPRAGGGRRPERRCFPPQAKSDLRATDAGIAGSRTWEFVVVPETGGTVEVPALAFSYFDPSAGRIVTAETAPLALRVEGGTVAAGLPVPPPAARAGGALPLRSDLDLRPAAGLAPSGRTVALAAGLALLLHAGLLGTSRLRGRSRGDALRSASPRSSARRPPGPRAGGGGGR